MAVKYQLLPTASEAFNIVNERRRNESKEREEKFNEFLRSIGGKIKNSIERGDVRTIMILPYSLSSQEIKILKKYITEDSMYFDLQDTEELQTHNESFLSLSESSNSKENGNGCKSNARETYMDTRLSMNFSNSSLSSYSQLRTELPARNGCKNHRRSSRKCDIDKNGSIIITHWFDTFFYSIPFEINNAINLNKTELRLWLDYHRLNNEEHDRIRMLLEPLGYRFYANEYLDVEWGPASNEKIFCSIL